MYLATGIRTTHDGDGNPRRGWLIHHVQGEQATYLGFVDFGRHDWSEIHKALPGILMLADVDVTPGEYERRNAASHRGSPEHMRRQGDAIEGN